MINTKTCLRMHSTVLLLGILSSTSLWAQEDLLLEQELLGEMSVPTVLTATRLSQPQDEVPASQTIITRDMIVASGVREIPSLLRLVPGFQVAHGLDLVSATYHGNSDLYSRRLQVLIDGRSVYTPLFGGVEWHDLPLSIDDIDRIEVTRGPNGVTYGANSFVAVVNIITLHPDVVRGHKTKLEAGERNVRRGYYRYAGGDNQWSYRISVEGMTDDYYDSHFDDDKQRQQINFRGDYAFDKTNHVGVSLGYLSGDTSKGQGSQTNPYRTEDITSHYQQIVWTHRLGNENEFKINFSHNYHRLDDTYDVVFAVPGALLIPPSANPVELLPYQFSQSGLEERYNLELVHTYRVNNQLRAVWGGEIRQDRLSGVDDFGQFNSSDTFTNHLYRLFGNAEWAYSKDLLFNAGLMVEKNDFTGTDVSPRLAVNYHVNRNHTIRAVASRAYRTPSFFEERADAVINVVGQVVPPFDIDTLYQGNRNLKPEKMTSFELGYLFQHPRKPLSFDTRLFYERIDDIISAARDDSFINANGVLDSVNLSYQSDGYSRTWGAEFQLDYKPSRDTQVWLAYSYARIRGRYLDVIQAGGNRIYADLGEAVPRHTLSALLSRKLGHGISASAGYYRTTTAVWPGGDSNGGYKALDFRLAKSFRLNGYKGQVELIVHDALDDYFEFDNNLINRSRALLALELEF